MFKHIVAALAVCVLTWGLAALADTIILKDGTRIEATSIMKVGPQYRVKTADGQTRTIPESQVKQIVKGGAPAAGGAGTGATGGAAGGATGGATVPPKGQPDASPKSSDAGAPPLPAAGATKGGTTATFAAVKQKADKVEVPLAAIGIWQAFIDSSPAHADLEAAKAELENWKQLNKDSAERINGKWVGGEERKKLLKKVDELVKEGAESLAGDQTVQGLKKLEEAIKLYPNSFEANFLIGYYYLTKGAVGSTGRGNVQYQDKAIKSLEAASRILPTSPATWSNLAIAYNFRNRYVDSVQAAYKAAKIKDSKEIVENLVNSISHAPPGMQRNNPKITPILEDAVILARKHGVDRGGSRTWNYIPPEEDDVTRKADPDDPKGEKGPPGVAGNGTGFFVSADGYIMTNEHVAKPGDYLMVRMHDGTEKLAKRIVIDDEQDIAILKIKVDKPVPYIKLAAYDSPKVGSDVAVLGYPLLSMFGMNSTVKITRGIVTAYDKDQDKCDITVDAQVNPGNSGGPMVDRYGNLLALVAMKTLAIDASISSYGLGLSTGRLRQFVEKQKSHFPDLAFEPGTAEGAGLSTEDLVDKIAPATVCILIMRGEDPGSENIDKSPAEGAAAPDATPPGTAAPKGGAKPAN